jgi:acyl-CoA synthetase (AMP-forming)/AMP-acid ligase II
MTECLAQDAQVHTPYGATEALPVASISALQRLAAGTQVSATMGGVCVGRRFAGIDWAVIEIRDAPIASLDDVARCEVGQIGELIVRGPQVTRTYVTSAEANALHKIHDGESVWHRMGDVGYLDDLDQFWFCGRKSQRVVTPAGPLYSVPVESVFDEHPQIYRSALVGLGRAPHQVPIVICEPWRENWSTGAAARRRLRDELGDLARANPRTAGINRDQVLLKASLPVDTRHNSKIFRERLVPWAEKQFRRAKRDG